MANTMKASDKAKTVVAENPDYALNLSLSDLIGIDVPVTSTEQFAAFLHLRNVALLNETLRILI